MNDTPVVTGNINTQSLEFGSSSSYVSLQIDANLGTGSSMTISFGVKEAKPKHNNSK